MRCLANEGEDLGHEVLESLLTGLDLLLVTGDLRLHPVLIEALGPRLEGIDLLDDRVQPANDPLVARAEDALESDANGFAQGRELVCD